MLAKLTSKNQLTLPKSAVESLDYPVYFDVAVQEGQLVLTPLRLQRGDAVRAKLAALGVAESDVTDAVRWVRSSKTARGAAAVAETSAGYTASRPAGSKPNSSPRKKATRTA